jgi:hypothetical protein
MGNAASRSLPVTAIAFMVLTAGCAAASLPLRYPSRAPLGMAAEQAERDERACVDLAARATAERAWAYIGCMVARGHTVGVAFRAQGETYFGVTQTRQHDQAVASSELDTCRRTAYGASRSEGSRDAIINRMETAFRSCVSPLGYTVQRDGAPAPGSVR